MRTMKKGEYRVVRLLILDMIYRGKVLRRPEIFRHIRNLPTTRFELDNSPELIKRVLDDVTDEDLVRELHMDAQSPQQFLLTREGQQELVHDRTEVSILLDGLQAVRALFPELLA